MRVKLFSERSVRTRLIQGFSLVIGLSVLFSAAIGIVMLRGTILRQARDKVRLDLNSAREIYQHASDNLLTITRLTAARYCIREGLMAGDRARLLGDMEEVRSREGFDVLTVTDSSGRVVVRTRNPERYGDVFDDPFIERVRNTARPEACSQIVPAAFLEREAPELARRAAIAPIPTPRAAIQDTTLETSGMMIRAAAPVFDEQGRLLGVLCGGMLVNRNNDIVDEVKDVVYRGERYRGVDIGTATIFQGDIRIATNVRNRDGTRAIGTRVSREVCDQVLVQGVPWIDRAFVVNAWYLTAYEPIRDCSGAVIGMLYVGMLEAPYTAMRNRILILYGIIAIVSMILVWVLGRRMADSITTPIRELVHGTERIARGDLAWRVAVESDDEIGYLAASFNRMADENQQYSENLLALKDSLAERVEEKTRELKAAHDHLIRTEKLGSIGKMAAGIAHEINNPLTSIVINTELIAERLDAESPLAENLELIRDESQRCSRIVRGLLDFSRQETPEKIPIDVNQLLAKTLHLFESQALIQGVTIGTDFSEALPRILVDPNKLEQVFANLFLNALDAMPEGGRLAIACGLSDDGADLVIEVTDSGCGIAAGELDKVFDPFFTTKGVNGTGLGLSVSYGIVQQHDGSIAIRSQPGEGTTVTIQLPVGPADATRQGENHDGESTDPDR